MKDDPQTPPVKKDEPHTNIDKMKDTPQTPPVKKDPPDKLQPTAPPPEGDKNRLYPVLPTHDDENGHAYRLQQITRIQTELKREAEKRAGLCKKYKRGLNAVDVTDAALASVGAGLGVGGVAFLSTVVAIPLAVGLELGSLGCAGLCVIGKVAGRRLTHKYVKHRRIEAIARAKLNSISDIVSNALADGNISDVEYRLILDEVRKFEDLRRETRATKAPSRKNMDELRKKLLAEGRKEALEELVKKLRSP